MKIALLGFGKMGQEIQRIALEKQHEIVAIFNLPSDWDTHAQDLKKADVAIDFSTPDAVIPNIYRCFEANIPVVVGTTGWLHQLEEIKKHCLTNHKSMLYGSNFSVGVNIFFEINKQLAALMSEKGYNVAIEEIHHTQKLDAPSGTAISLATDIIAQYPEKTSWVNNPTNLPNELEITSLRIDKTPGTHTITYDNYIDTIEIRHTAKNRLGFASGAVIAAEWLYNKKGFFTVKDALGL